MSPWSPRLVSLALLLSACQASGSVVVPGTVQPPSKLEQFTQADLASASALAEKAGDQMGSVCWAYLAALATVWTSQPGVAVGIELTRLPKTGAFVTACGPIEAELPIRFPNVLP